MADLNISFDGSNNFIFPVTWLILDLIFTFSIGEAYI